MTVSPQTNGQKTISTLWRERILKRDFEIVLGKMLQSDQGREDETEESYLRSANVQWEGVDLSDVKTMWFSSAEKRDLLLREGDLVVNEGGDVGRCAIWRGIPESFYFQNAINRVRARTSASTRFLYYWLYNIKHAGFIDAMVSRITIAHLTAEKLARVPWPDVPSAEQRRIAAYLDASCAAIDAAMAAKRRQLETLVALRTTLIYEAVTQGINRNVATVVHDIPSYGYTPKHWKRSKLRYEISIQNGDFASDKLQDDGAYPVLGGNGVMGHTDLSNVDGETVVIGRVGAYCGNAHYVQGRAWVSDNALIVKSRHHARFLCHLFNALNFNAQANNTAQPVITGTKIKNTYVALPPFAEQEAICVHLDEKLGELKRIVTGIESQIATLTAYRKSLIHEYVTGQRRITVADVARVRRGESEQ